MNPIPARSVTRTVPRLPETRHHPWRHIAILTPAIACLSLLGAYIIGGRW